MDPDIVVEQDPLQAMQGGDPLLERGVPELITLLHAAPPGQPPGPAAPDKTPGPPRVAAQ